jgi:predicted nucleic acid-binding protein
VSKYLLDTNVVSELRKARPHGAVVAWIDALRADQVCLSAVTLGELQKGVERTRRQDPIKAAEIESLVDLIGTTYTVLPMDSACFREWARLMEGKSDRLSEDGMIAATARIHGLIIATRNERDFQGLGVEIVNPFKTARPPVVH